MKTKKAVDRVNGVAASRSRIMRVEITAGQLDMFPWVNGVRNEWFGYQRCLARMVGRPSWVNAGWQYSEGRCA